MPIDNGVKIIYIITMILYKNENNKVFVSWWLIISTIIIFAVAWLLIGKPNDDAYNKHVCAVYGYEADCKTPLPAEKRLK